MVETCDSDPIIVVQLGREIKERTEIVASGMKRWIFPKKIQYLTQSTKQGVTIHDLDHARGFIWLV